MKYLLDTNTCIALLNGKAPKLTLWFAQRPTTDIISVCSVVKAEMFYGAAKSKYTAQNRRSQELFFRPFISYDFDEAAANAYAGLRAFLESIGEPIGANDMLIAAIALANELSLVTRNVGEFARVPHLRVEPWEPT